MPGPLTPRRTIIGYVVALGSLFAFIVARAALKPVLGDAPAVVLFLVPVGIGAWFGGFGPGLATTIVGCVVGLTFFGQRPGMTVVEISRTQYWLTRAIPYTLVGGFISFLSAHLERARREAEREKIAAHEAREVAEHASRLKDDFLATISHELRTPLSAIVGWASLLQQQQDSGESDPEIIREGIEVIRRNARAQSQLIEDILDVARITSGRVRIDARRVDLRDPIEAALNTVHTAAVAKEVNLTADFGPANQSLILAGDADRLQQIFWNLLSNAIKFTDPGGHVRLTVRVVPKDGAARATVSVIDDGHGIEPAFVPHVFERFRQADMSTTRRQGGLGLGLSIVRQLVELHGGEVAVFSDGLGKGSRFDVILPVTIQTRATVDPEHVEGAHDGGADEAAFDPLRGARVLLVEDDPDARRIVEATLARRGSKVTSVDNVEAALLTLRAATVPTHDAAPGTVAAEPFTAIVSDIGMPGMDGYAFIRSVREGEAAAGRRRVPALALTAYTRELDRTQTLAAGFDAFLAKPAEPELLARTVAAMVDAAR